MNDGRNRSSLDLFSYFFNSILELSVYIHVCIFRHATGTNDFISRYLPTIIISYNFYNNSFAIQGHLCITFFYSIFFFFFEVAYYFYLILKHKKNRLYYKLYNHLIVLYHLILNINTIKKKLQH
jgi:hypothetical protein